MPIAMQNRKDTRSSMEKPTLLQPLLPRIASGDSLAVQDCLSVYGGLIWSIARRMCQDRAEAEDAVQEIFIELWQVASTFDPNLSSESTFVTMIARRRLIDRMRRNKTRLERQSLSGDDLERVSELEPNRAELADEAAKAAVCFEKLARDTQRTLHLSIHQGCSHSEISKHLDLPLGTVKSFARRGLLQLRDCMTRQSMPSAASEVS